jgi:hypothetical protein
MGKQLNIKGDALYAKVERLADLTGTTLTGAVEAAVDAKLAATERERDVARRTQEVLALAAELRASMAGPPMSNEELNRMLYDERGLPKGAWPGGD